MTSVARRAGGAAPHVTAPSSGAIDPDGWKPLTCSIGAEVSNVDLGVASRDPALMANLRSLLLSTRCCSSRPRITREEHVTWRYFGDLEDHPVAGSDPDYPGLVRIYKSPDAPNDRYENAWHTDATWREQPAVRVCVALCRMSAGWRRHDVGDMALAYGTLPNQSSPDRRAARAPQHRGNLWRGHAAREAPRIEVAVSRRGASVVRTHPETGEISFS